MEILVVLPILLGLGLVFIGGPILVAFLLAALTSDDQKGEAHPTAWIGTKYLPTHSRNGWIESNPPPGPRKGP